jgi:hypothetical protein
MAQRCLSQKLSTSYIIARYLYVIDIPVRYAGCSTDLDTLGELGGWDAFSNISGTFTNVHGLGDPLCGFCINTGWSHSPSLVKVPVAPPHQHNLEPNERSHSTRRDHGQEPRLQGLGSGIWASMFASSCSPSFFPAPFGAGEVGVSWSITIPIFAS